MNKVNNTTLIIVSVIVLLFIGGLIGSAVTANAVRSVDNDEPRSLFNKIFGAKRGDTKLEQKESFISKWFGFKKAEPTVEQMPDAIRNADVASIRQDVLLAGYDPSEDIAGGILVDDVLTGVLILPDVYDDILTGITDV
ncbi:hypothetical protein CL616_02650, partial [archaeon]|nr:hypothetical protein [archaeon]